jgi:FeS assembly SUF system regulator
MIKLTRLADYGIVLAAHFAREPDLRMHSARDLATATRLPLPTVSKILKRLARRGLLVAQRGTKGGFKLSRRPEEISVADVIDALEGPIALTECSGTATHACWMEERCPVGINWRLISEAVSGTLSRIKLSEMVHPKSAEVVQACEPPAIRV